MIRVPFDWHPGGKENHHLLLPIRRQFYAAVENNNSL